MGFAVGVGGIFKIPMPGGLTDTASFQFNYTEGASRYAVVTQPGAGSPNMFSSSGQAACPVFGPPVAGLLPGCQGSIGLGYWTDGIYGNPRALGSATTAPSRTPGCGASTRLGTTCGLPS